MPSPTDEQKLQVFVSYSPNDKELFKDLLKHLTPLTRTGGFVLWHDELILPGERWQEVTEKNLDAAEIILLLISSHYLISERTQAQMERALERHEEGRARVIPIRLRPALWSTLPIARLQALPLGDKPLTSWGSRDEAWVDVVQGVHNAITSARKSSSAPSPGREAPRPKSVKPAAPRTPRAAKKPRSRVQGAQSESLVLHLSDLHFGTKDQAQIWYGQLAQDLHELGCEELDAVILSGDITNRSAPEEYAAASFFLEKLLGEFQLEPRQLVLVPGNHDLSWDLAKKAYGLHRRSEFKGKLEADSIIEHPGDIVEVREESAYRQRFEPFSKFYAALKGAPYPLEYDEQAILQHFPEKKLLVLGLNSAWQLDHAFTKRASIHPVALSRALTALRTNPEYEDTLKIAVWHHPLSGNGEDRIRDSGFLEQLAQAGFRLVLHGHIHTSKTENFRHDMTPKGRHLTLVCAGTFGAPTQEWVPGHPLGYNVLRIGGSRVTVETRRREELNGAWKPDARWLQGAGRDPRPRYEIEL